ncbi:MAG: hypothetical protein ACLFNR_03135 [Candidatus Paceibacterota bacterium]
MRTAKRKEKKFILRLMQPDSHKERKKAVIFLAVVFLGLSFVYFFLLVQTVFNTVAHQDIDSEIPRINASLQKTKFKYISIRNDLDEDKIDALGLVALDEGSIEYISREPVGFRGGI